MKPLNINTTGCDPVSSNCVIWQGPDIPCIKLCKGDTVSDVVFKLATELCEVLEQLDVKNYIFPPDCFPNQSCSPADFHELIQIIINKLCCLESIPEAVGCAGTGLTSNSSARVASNTTGGGCPDCTVEIAKCFQYEDEFGDLVTTMQLVDYTRTIGNRLCTLVNDIFNLQTIVADLDVRVTALENAPAPTINLPTVTPTCTMLPAVPMPMSTVLTALEQQYCQLVSVTGNPTSLSNSIAQQCLDLNNSPVLGPSGTTMSAIPGWNLSPGTIANAMNNMWLTVCDLRAAVRTIQLNCCPSGCDGIDFNLNAVLSASTLTLYFTGTLPPGFTDCNPAGNRFSITDTLGNAIYVNINTISSFNVPSGFPIDMSVTPINLASDINISSDVCLSNTSTNATCTFCVEYKVVNTSLCPTLTVTFNDLATVATISYSPYFLPATYTVEVWNSTYTSTIFIQSAYQTTGGTKYVTVPGLSNSTVFHARLVITAGSNTTECPYTTFTTPPVVCTAPNNMAASISLPVECINCGTAVNFVDSPTVDGTYVDLSSPYLYEYSSGSFGDPVAELAQLSVTTAQVGSLTATRNTVYANGKVFVASDNGGTSKIEVLDWNSGVPLIEETINVGPGTGAVNSMCYDSATNLIYILGMPVFGTLVISTLSYTSPGVYTLTDAVLPAQAGVLYPWRIANNPFNGKKYVTSTTGLIYVYTSGVAPTLSATITSPGTAFYRGNISFNSSNGDVWVTTPDTTATDEVYVINGTTNAVITALSAGVAGYAVDSGSLNGPMHTLTFYPGDGSVGSARMFALYSDTATLSLYKIVEYNVNAPYTSAVFYTDATVYAANLVCSLFYSSSFNKLFYQMGGIPSSVRAFNPQDATSYFDAPVGITTNILAPVEDTLNNKVVYYSFANNPTTNVFWFGLDPALVTECTSGKVKMYIGNNGPYIWDSTGMEWDVMTSSSVAASTPAVGQFTVTSILHSSIVAASLVISNDYGLTWTAYPDTGGNIYGNPAAWATGRIYPNLGLGALIKINFTTTSGCGLEGPILT